MCKAKSSTREVNKWRFSMKTRVELNRVKCFVKVIFPKKIFCLLCAVRCSMEELIMQNYSQPVTCHGLKIETAMNLGIHADI